MRSYYTKTSKKESSSRLAVRKAQRKNCINLLSFGDTNCNKLTNSQYYKCHLFKTVFFSGKLRYIQSISFICWFCWFSFGNQREKISRKTYREWQKKIAEEIINALMDFLSSSPKKDDKKPIFVNLNVIKKYAFCVSMNKIRPRQGLGGLTDLPMIVRVKDACFIIFSCSSPESTTRHPLPNWAHIDKWLKSASKRPAKREMDKHSI